MEEKGGIIVEKEGLEREREKEERNMDWWPEEKE